jgi:hypothetical protein
MIGGFDMMQGEVSRLVRLPPPLRGRAGERGKPRASAEDMRRQFFNEPGNAINQEASVVLALRQATEQAAPLSLTSRASFARLGPRKGGGNPFAGASLTYIDVASVESGFSR